MILNAEQRAAIAHDGHLALTSCPGSGKTRTIVAKILRCIESVRDTTRRVGCITYTHAGVNEVEQRLRLHGGDDELYYEISTIHSFCLRHVLAGNARCLPEFATGFEILAPDDPRWDDLVSELLREFHLSSKLRDRFEGVDRRAGGAINCPTDLPPPAAWEFVHRLDALSLIPFSEIVYQSCRVLERRPYVARGVASRFAHLLIDEFQDTTCGQVEILGLIAAFGITKFFLVGDPNQAIMGFAGASPDLMDQFATHLSARTDVRLVGNYRCSPRIIAHAELLCPTDPCMQSVGSSAECTIEPEWVHTASVASGIYDHFIPAVESLNIRLGDAAVLAPWWITLLSASRELRSRNVPMVGPGARPYRKSRDFAQLAEQVGAYTETPSADACRSSLRALFFMIQNITGKADWSVFSYEGRKTLFTLLAVAIEVRRRTDSARDWLTEIAGGYSEILVRRELLPSDKGNVLPDSASAMLADMERNSIDVANASVSDLSIFARPGACLNLLTMHGSKGREFDAVAIVDLHDGRVPHFTASRPEEFAESRRLLYVAVTRAKRLLMYFTDRSNGKNRPSPYLLEDGLRLNLG